MSFPSQSRFKEIVDKFPKLDPIMVLGDVGVDKYTYGTVDRISPEAPVPVVAVTKEWNKLGLAANVADNLIGLDIKNYLCGVIGNDKHAEELLTLMKDSGLKTDAMVRANRRTTFKERVVTNIQQICRVDYESKNNISDSEILDVEKTVRGFMNEISAIIIEDYGKGMLNKALCQWSIKEAREQNKLVVVDPSRRTNPHFFRGASLLKPNQVETKVICEKLGYHEDNVEHMASLLLEKLDLDMVIITLGAKGMGSMAKSDGKWVVIPTVAKEVFDVSGAGDTAISVITSSLLAGATLEEASWLGNCASGVVVGKKGTARVSRDELLAVHHQLETQL